MLFLKHAKYFKTSTVLYTNNLLFTGINYFAPAPPSSPASLNELLINPKVIHFAEQRAAPYSQKGSREKRYTVDNNTGGTHNLLVAIVESGLDIHVCHLGTMGYVT